MVKRRMVMIKNRIAFYKETQTVKKNRKKNSGKNAKIYLSANADLIARHFLPPLRRPPIV